MKTLWLRALPFLVLFAAGHAWAGNPIINASTNVIQGNSPSQTVQLTISGTDNISGEDLYVQINDGMSGPLITKVDILTSTIFASNNTGEHGGHSPTGVITSGTYAGHLAILSTTTLSGSVLDSGLLATITFDTTNFGPNPFALNIVNTANGDSDLLTISGSDVIRITPSFPNNQFTVTPEPGTFAVLALGVLVLCRRPSNRAHRD